MLFTVKLKPNLLQQKKCSYITLWEAFHRIYAKSNTTMHYAPTSYNAGFSKVWKHNPLRQFCNVLRLCKLSASQKWMDKTLPVIILIQAYVWIAGI